MGTKCPRVGPRFLKAVVLCYYLAATVCFHALLSGAMAEQDPGIPGLRTLATKHYLIHTDLDDALARELAEDLEFCFGEFSRRLSMFEGLGRPGSDQPFNVYLLKNHADYVKLSGGEFPNTGGLFISRTRTLAVYLEGQGREQMRKTLRHEAFHQFAHEKVGPGLPVWLNEGLAQLFEESLRMDDQLRVGLVPPDRLRQLQHDVVHDRLVDFQAILQLNDEGWARTLADRGRAATHYTQAWAMVHFLIYAQDARGNALYRDRFNAMLLDIAEGRTGWGAFTDRFGHNLDGFRQRFTQYVQGLRATPEAKTLDDQRVLAELLVLLRQRGMNFKSVEDFREHVVERRYRLECRRDDVIWSTDPDVGVYFRDTKGRLLDSRQLRFMPDPLGEMPLLIRRPGDGLVYNTRFYLLGDRLMHETHCESDFEPSQVTRLP